MCRKTSLGKEPDMAPLECMLAVLFAAGMAWLAACIYALAKRRELDTRLLAQAVHQIALGRHAYVRDLVRDDPRWTPRMIARAADGAAGKPAEILEALPETFLADLVRVRERIGRLRTIAAAGIAAGVLHVLTRPAAGPPPAAGAFSCDALFDPAILGLVLLIATLASCLPLKNQATLLALRARQEIGTLIARARAATPDGN
jgi:hypothetical protein